MNANEIAIVAKNAGFREVGLQVAVAIALAESRGDPNAAPTNKDGSKDRGLWQINNRYHKEVSDACAFNPDCAAKAVYRISSGGVNWSQWATFTNHAYLAYMSVARAAVNSIKTSATITPGSSGGNTGGWDWGNIWHDRWPWENPNAHPERPGAKVADTTESVAHGVDVLTKQATWVRVGLVTGGGILIILALMMILRSEAMPKLGA